MLRHMRLPDGRELLSIFDADLSGRDVPRGKPDPALFLLAAQELGIPPQQCMVVEDAPAGVEAAKAGGMAALGIARLGDQALLDGAGADLVVTSLDDVDLVGIGAGVLRALPVEEAAPPHEVLQPTREPNWVLSHHGYSVLTENIVESRFSLGNGFMGMRAARPISRGPTWVSWLELHAMGVVAALLRRGCVRHPQYGAAGPRARASRRLVEDSSLARRGTAPGAGRRVAGRRPPVETCAGANCCRAGPSRTPAGVIITGRRASSAVAGGPRCGPAIRFHFRSRDRDGVDAHRAGGARASNCRARGWNRRGWIRIYGALAHLEGTRKGVAMASEASLSVGGEKLTPEHPFPLRWAWRWRSVAGQPVEFNRLVGVARSDAPQDDQLLSQRGPLWRAVVRKVGAPSRPPMKPPGVTSGPSPTSSSTATTTCSARSASRSTT